MSSDTHEKMLIAALDTNPQSISTTSNQHINPKRSELLDIISWETIWIPQFVLYRIRLLQQLAHSTTSSNTHRNYTSQRSVKICSYWEEFKHSINSQLKGRKKLPKYFRICVHVQEVFPILKKSKHFLSYK